MIVNANNYAGIELTVTGFRKRFRKLRTCTLISQQYTVFLLEKQNRLYDYFSTMRIV
jgi:hypothetical protein